MWAPHRENRVSLCCRVSVINQVTCGLRSRGVVDTHAVPLEWAVGSASQSMLTDHSSLQVLWTCPDSQLSLNSYTSPMSFQVLGGHTVTLEKPHQGGLCQSKFQVSFLKINT